MIRRGGGLNIENIADLPVYCAKNVDGDNGYITYPSTIKNIKCVIAYCTDNEHNYIASFSNNGEIITDFGSEWYSNSRLSGKITIDTATRKIYAPIEILCFGFLIFY